MDTSSLAPNLPYSTLLLVTGLLAALLAAAAPSRRRSAPGAGPLALAMAGIAVWSLTYALFWADPRGPLGSFWLTATYLGVVTVPGAYFAFALRFTGRGRWLTRPVLAVLVLEPLLTLALLWTDRWHGLYYAGRAHLNTGMILHGGPVFSANVAFSQLLIVTANALHLAAWWRARGLYRTQLGLVAAAGVAPQLASLVFIAGLSPLPNADLTPFTMGLTGACFAYALFRFDLLDVRPVARDLLVERLPDGVVVLDALDRVVDFNPAAERLLGESALRIGQPAPPEVRARLAGAGDTTVATEDGARYHDVSVTELRGDRGARTGTLLVWRDVTDRTLAERRLERLAHTDVLSGLPNRRAFDRDFDGAFDRARARDGTLGVLLADVDGLKRVNDTEGHARGDALLRAFAAALDRALAGRGRVYRLGGDEYAALLPDLRPEETAGALDLVRGAVNELRGLGFPGADASVGLALFPHDERRPSDLVRLADERMYDVKRARPGRARSL